jgi:ABC-type transport system substrate-binding protein
VSGVVRNKTGRFGTFCGFFIVYLLLSSCHSQNRIAGYIYYRLNANPTTLDPALVTDVTGGVIAAKLFNGLVKLDPDLNVVPDIADRWEIGDNGRSFLFHLRRGVRFVNGREVTAQDVRFSFMRILDPKGKSPNSWVLEKIAGAREFMDGSAKEVAGIRVIDRYTVMIRLERTFSPFLNLLTMTAAYIVPKEEVEKWGIEFGAHAAGTGPFAVSRWNNDSELVLKRNDRYFKGPAHVKGIVYRVIPEELTAVTEFETGNLDVLTIPAYEYSHYARSPLWRGLVSSAKGLNTYYVGFNCARPPFDNVRLRRAVACAIDREKILKTYYERRGRLAEGPVPDLLRKWRIKMTYRYDPVQARRIVEEEKALNKRIYFYITADQEVVDIAEIIQSFLRKAGLDVRIRQLEWSAYKAALNRGDADMFWISWWADYPDPENFLFPLFHSSNHGAGGNRSWYTNKEVDHLIEKGQAETRAVERDRYYGRAENIVVRDLPWVCFWHRNDYTLRQAYVKNYRIYPIYSIDKGTEISL